MPLRVRRMTSAAASAVSVIQIDGIDASFDIKRYWQSSSKRTTLPINAICYGHWLSSSEDCVVCQTAIDRIEVHCHGGSQASATIINDLVNAGAIIDEPLNDIGPSSLIENAAWTDLANASSIKVIRCLLKQANGALSNELHQINQCSDSDAARERLQRLNDLQRIGVLMLSPPQVAIIGPPNVGKSTLLNRLLGWDRAIVHDQPGTTRDLLRESIVLDGWPFTLIDSAGIRATRDSIEQAGISKALEVAAQADLILLLVDPISGWTEFHENLHAEREAHTQVVVTKADLILKPHIADSIIASSVCVSAKSGVGIDALIKCMIKKVGFDQLEAAEAVPFRNDQLPDHPRSFFQA
jgi:tRNA modification GTPase